METILKQELNIDKTNWKLVKFGDVVFEPKETIKDIVSDGIEHVVGLEHITSGDVHLRNSASIDESTTFTKKFAKGDVLFGRRRAYLKKAAVAHFDGICSGDITVFRAKSNLLPELLPFIVNNDKFFDYAVQHSAGGLSPRVKFKDLANYEFLLPPKDQQAQLAELLWAMDEVIECDRKLFNNINQILYSQKKEFFEQIEENKFEVKSFNEICIQINPGKLYSKETVFQTGNIPVISQSESGFLGFHNEEPGVLASNENPVLTFSNHTCVLRYQYQPFSVIQNVFILKAKKGIELGFLYWLLNGKVKMEFYGGHMPKLRKKKFKIPSLERQKEILNTLNKIESILDQSLLKIQSSQSLQKSLINQVF